MAGRHASPTLDGDGRPQSAGVDNRVSGGRPSPEEIAAAATPRGGFTRETLAGWGVPWPPPAGWRARLEGRDPVPVPPAFQRDASAERLENSRDNCSGWTRWSVLDELRKFTTEPWQALCMQRTDSAGVAVGRSGGAMTLGGVKPCGKRYCPVCAPQIQAVRRGEIAECVEAAREQGWTTLFLTLTLRHTRSDSLVALLDALDVSWRAMTRGGFWSRVKRQHGLRHFVRVTEVQEGGTHGWHPHAHVLLFLDTAAARGYSPAGLESMLVAEWARVVDAAGYQAAGAAQRLVEPQEEHLRQMSGYFTKELAESLAWEMTGALSKRSVRESLNPHELLMLAVGGDAAARAAWRELEEATRSRRMIAYSAHARRDLRIEAAKSVDQILEEVAARPVQEPLCSVLAADWNEHASRAGFRAALAEVVEDERTTPEDLLWWLDSHGIRASIAAPVRARPPRPPDVGPPGMEWLVQPDEHGGFD